MEIKFLENEMLDFQQDRFGPNGDLMIKNQIGKTNTRSSIYSFAGYRRN
jgi:hypothetical protein